MSTPPTTLEAAYRALDPQEALYPGGDAYTARPAEPLATLATQLRLEQRPGLHLVSGHIGSGKTTELRRLEAQLTPRTRFVPLDAISRSGQLSTIEVCSALLLASASVTMGLPLTEIGNSSEFRAAFRQALSLATPTGYRAVVLVAGAISAPLGSFLDQAPRVTNGTKDDGETEHVLLQAIRMITENAKPGATPIVILDGLDKLSLSELEPTLARVASWNLPLSLVATVPLSYLFTPSFSRRESSFAGVHVVPAQPVVQRDQTPNPSAIAWFSSVLESRGVRELFDDDAAEVLTIKTAGIIRDFVRSSREAVLAALVQGRTRVDLDMAMIALEEFALRMSRPVSGDDLRVLNIVAETGRVVGHSTFLALIDGGQIVEYRNGSNWYAVHPLLRDIVVRFAEGLAS